MAGRQAFIELGCISCHAVAGIGSSDSGGQTPGGGPELTGMGAHHPAAYFAESILNPNAVIVEGPGYASSDGQSRMPAYPTMSVQQLVDVVAFLRSLTQGGEQLAHAGISPSVAAPTEASPKGLPSPPAHRAGLFFVQIYDVQDGRLQEFEHWFSTEGRTQLLAYPGLLSIESYVDRTPPGPSLRTVFGFRDLAALTEFLSDPRLKALGAKFDEFLGPHEHYIFRSPPLYPVSALTAGDATSRHKR